MIVVNDYRNKTKRVVTSINANGNENDLRNKFDKLKMKFLSKNNITNKFDERNMKRNILDLISNWKSVVRSIERLVGQVLSLLETNNKGTIFGLCERNLEILIDAVDDLKRPELMGLVDLITEQEKYDDLTKDQKIEIEKLLEELNSKYPSSVISSFCELEAIISDFKE